MPLSVFSAPSFDRWRVGRSACNSSGFGRPFVGMDERRDGRPSKSVFYISALISRSETDQRGAVNDISNLSYPDEDLRVHVRTRYALWCNEGAVREIKRERRVACSQTKGSLVASARRNPVRLLPDWTWVKWNYNNNYVLEYHRDILFIDAVYAAPEDLSTGDRKTVGWKKFIHILWHMADAAY